MCTHRREHLQTPGRALGRPFRPLPQPLRKDPVWLCLRQNLSGGQRQAGPCRSRTAARFPGTHAGIFRRRRPVAPQQSPPHPGFHRLQIPEPSPGGHPPGLWQGGNCLPSTKPFSADTATPCWPPCPPRQPPIFSASSATFSGLPESAAFPSPVTAPASISASLRSPCGFSAAPSRRHCAAICSVTPAPGAWAS